MVFEAHCMTFPCTELLLFNYAKVNTVFHSMAPLIFGMSTLCSNYSSTSLWHSVNIFPENFNTNSIPCLLQLKPKAFLWMYNRSVQFIFQLGPNLLDGVDVWTLRGPVHHFQCSSRFLPPQVVLAIVCFIGIEMANSTKTTETALNLPRVLIILNTTVYAETNK